MNKTSLLFSKDFSMHNVIGDSYNDKDNCINPNFV